MKKAILSIVVLLSFFLVSCSKTTTENDLWSDFRQQNQAIGACIETENAVYILEEGFVYFSEKNSNLSDWMVLCNMPNCNHSTIDCNGYVGSASIGYYNNKIYYARSDQDVDQGKISLVLYSMELDGSNHKKVQVLRENVAGVAITVDYHRQFCIWQERKWDDESEKDNAVLYLINIDNRELVQVIDSTESGGFYYTPADNYIYLTTRNDNHTKLSRYEIETGKIEIMIENWNVPYYGIPTEAYYTKDGVYYYDHIIGLCYYDFRSQEEQILRNISSEEHGSARSDGEYMYLTSISTKDYPIEKQKLFIYNMEGTLLNHIDLPYVSPNNPYWLYTTTQKDIIISNNFTAYPLYYMSKEEMLLADSQWKDCDIR